MPRSYVTAMVLLLVGVGASSVLAGPEEMLGIGLDEAWPDATFVEPLQVTNAGDGSNMLYVVERRGRILRLPKYEGSGKVPRPDVFVDMSSVVGGLDSQGGLLCIAFHPKYRQNRKFYACYVDENKDPKLRYRLMVAELTSDASRGQLRSLRVLLEVRKEHAGHNGGCIVFGPDGKLYISIGDDRQDPLLGAAHASQKPRSPLGKILRIDVDTRTGRKQYGIPADNPWASKPDKALPEMWAYGMRNPWRMSFDSRGRLWTVEPGTSAEFAKKQGGKTREWVTQIVRAGNHGWPYFEGTRKISEPPAWAKRMGLVPKTFEYVNDGRRMAGIGGFVYRGTRVPELFGKYIFGDFKTEEIYAIDLVRSGGTVEGRNWRKIGDVVELASLGEDEQGELYFCSNSQDGYVVTMVSEQ